MLSFDPTIQLGTLLELGVVLLTGLGVVFMMRVDVKALKIDVNELQQDMHKITDILITLSRQDERLKSLEHRADALERS